MSKIKDLTGQRFGRLTVVELAKIGNYGHTYWLCRCDCGNKKEVKSNNLIKGDTTSCGCYQRETIGNRNRKPEGEASKNYLYRQYKTSAKRRGHSFELTVEQCEIFFQGNCYYCGAKPSNVANGTNCNGVYIYSGIDRDDNKKGYTVENCVSCCKNCNYSKGDGTRKEFIDWILRAAQFILSKR